MRKRLFQPLVLALLMMAAIAIFAVAPAYAASYSGSPGNRFNCTGPDRKAALFASTGSLQLLDYTLVKGRITDYNYRYLLHIIQLLPLIMTKLTAQLATGTN